MLGSQLVDGWEGLRDVGLVEVCVPLLEECFEVTVVHARPIVFLCLLPVGQDIELLIASLAPCLSVCFLR